MAEVPVCPGNCPCRAVRQLGDFVDSVSLRGFRHLQIQPSPSAQGSVTVGIPARGKCKGLRELDTHRPRDRRSAWVGTGARGVSAVPEALLFEGLSWALGQGESLEGERGSHVWGHAVEVWSERACLQALATAGSQFPPDPPSLSGEPRTETRWCSRGARWRS